MEAIFINRNLNSEEETNILKRISSGKEYAVYSNVKVSEKLSTYSKGPYELTPEEKKKINYDIFDKVIQFGEIKINGKAITDLLMVEKASIWHYHKFRVYFTLTNLFYEIELVDKLALQYRNIDCYSSNSLLIDCFKTKKTKIILPKKNRNSYLNYTLLNYVIFFVCRVFLSSLHLSKLKRKNHIIVDHTIKQTCLNINSLKPEPGNYNLQYLFDKLEKDFIVLDDIEIPKFNGKGNFKLTTSYFKMAKHRLFGESVLFKGIFSKKIWKSLKGHLSFLKDQYRIIEPKLENRMDILILRIIKSLHYSNKLFIFKYLAYDHFFKQHSFRSVSSIDENSPRIKSILDAAKKNGITTFGIQHGVIHDLQPNYHFTATDKSRRIAPDFTLVWGSFWEKKLIDQGNYQKNSIIITGFIRTDIIPKLINTLNRTILNLPSGRKIIVFASQPIADSTLRRQIALDVFTGLREIKDSILVVKLHPAEANDISYYKAIAMEAKLSEVIFTNKIDLYLLLSRADIILTSFSTVGLESVFFNKPLIIIDPLQQDVQNYHKDGIAFRASNSRELESYIQKINNRELSLDQNAYKAYLNNQVTKIDGNVSRRCIEAIKTNSKKQNGVQ